MSGDPRGERLQIMLTLEELTAVDTWRFGRRMPSRAAAVRELLRRRGLTPKASQYSDGNTKSGDYGVIANEKQKALRVEKGAPANSDKLTCAWSGLRTGRLSKTLMLLLCRRQRGTTCAMRQMTVAKTLMGRSAVRAKRRHLTVLV